MLWVNIVSLILGIIFSAYFLYWTFKKKSNYLALFFLVYIFILLKYLLPEFKLIYHSLDQLTWLIGPLVYFFVTKNNEKLSWKSYLHLIPFVIAFISMLFYKSLGDSFSIISILFSPIFRSAHSILYILLAALEAKNNKWMKWVIISTSFLLTLTYVISFNIIDTTFISSSIAYALFVVGYICIQYINETQFVTKTDDNELIQLELVYQKVLGKIKDEQLYLNKSIKLSELSGELKLNDKIISKAINIYAKENFNAFVNRFRVAHAATLINSEKFSYYTIDAIAEESGFSNKVSFYKAFKRIETVSPSKYRQNAQNKAQQGAD